MMPTLFPVPEIMRRSPQSRLVHDWRPKSDLGLTVLRAIPHLPEELAAELIDKIKSAVVVESSLSVTVMRGWGLYLAGLIPLEAVGIEEWGEVSRKVITDNGVAFLTQAFDNTTEAENQKYHGLGTGTNAEATTDTALQTELTTEYNPNSTRATGSQAHASGVGSATYTTVGTNTLDSGTPAVTEHGIFSASSAGTLFDRSKFTAINLVGANADALQTTYVLTATSGG